MRIPLVDPQQDRKRRQRSRRRRPRRKTRTYHTAIPRPEVQKQRRAQKRRPAAERKADRTSTRTRRPARTSSGKGINWGKVGLRIPAVMLLVGLALLIVYGSVDARFFVYEAEIVGNNHLSAETIYNTAEIHEQHIFWIEPQTVVEKLAGIPGIKGAKVRCSLPGKVTITVQEREPVLMWRTRPYNNKDWWIDNEGVVLPYGPKQDPMDFIQVADNSSRELVEGETIQPPEIVDWVQQMAGAIPGARQFYYQDDRGLNYRQDIPGGNWMVYVGNGKNFARKIQAVQALNTYLLNNNIHPDYVDVRWPDLPVYGTKPAPDTEGGE